MNQEEIDQAFKHEVEPEFERIYSESDTDMTKALFFMLCDDEEIADFRSQWLRITLAIKERGLIAPQLFEGMKISEDKS